MVFAFKPACLAMSRKLTPSGAVPASLPCCAAALIPESGAGRIAARRFSSGTTSADWLSDCRNFRLGNDNLPVTLPCSRFQKRSRRKPPASSKALCILHSGALLHGKRATLQPFLRGQKQQGTPKLK